MLESQHSQGSELYTHGDTVGGAREPKLGHCILGLKSGVKQQNKLKPPHIFDYNSAAGICTILNYYSHESLSRGEATITSMKVQPDNIL